MKLLHACPSWYFHVLHRKIADLFIPWEPQKGRNPGTLQGAHQPCLREYGPCENHQAQVVGGKGSCQPQRPHWDKARGPAAIRRSRETKRRVAGGDKCTRNQDSVLSSRKAKERGASGAGHHAPQPLSPPRTPSSLASRSFGPQTD